MSSLGGGPGIHGPLAGVPVLRDAPRPRPAPRRDTDGDTDATNVEGIEGAGETQETQGDVAARLPPPPKAPSGSPFTGGSSPLVEESVQTAATRGNSIRPAPVEIPPARALASYAAYGGSSTGTGSGGAAGRTFSSTSVPVRPAPTTGATKSG